MAEQFARQQAEFAETLRKNQDLTPRSSSCGPRSRRPRPPTLASPDTHDYNEAETRDSSSTCCSRRPAGRSTSRRTGSSRSPACRTPSGKGNVDYVLWDDDGKPLGLVEAKRTMKRRAGRPAPGKALRRRLGSAVRPAAGHLLHQRLRDLDLGRPALPAARGPGLLHQGRAGLLIQRRTSRQALDGLRDQRRDRRPRLPGAGDPPDR